MGLAGVRTPSISPGRWGCLLGHLAKSGGQIGPELRAACSSKYRPCRSQEGALTLALRPHSGAFGRRALGRRTVRVGGLVLIFWAIAAPASAINAALIIRTRRIAVISVLLVRAGVARSVRGNRMPACGFLVTCVDSRIVGHVRGRLTPMHWGPGKLRLMAEGSRRDRLSAGRVGKDHRQTAVGRHATAEGVLIGCTQRSSTIHERASAGIRTGR